MRIWLYGFLASLLIGCGTSAPVLVEHTTLSVCPAVPASGVCPPFPVLGEQVTVEEIEDAWIEAQRVYRECHAVLIEWAESWQSCSD